MKLARAALVAALGFALPALAYAPAQSLRPLPRPVSTPAPQSPADRVVGPSDPLVVTIRATDLAPSASLRPIYRPGRAEQVTELRPDQTIVAELPPEETEERGPPRGLLALLTGQNRRNPAGMTAVRVSLRPVERPAGLAAAIRAAETRGTPGRVTQPGQRGAQLGLGIGQLGEQIAVGLEPVYSNSSKKATSSSMVVSVSGSSSELASRTPDSSASTVS